MGRMAREHAGGTVADRLTHARRTHFAGRRAELALFRSALTAATPPFTVLHVHGPAGVGKTTLLSAFEDAARDAGAEPVRLDLRDIDPVPGAFEAALAGHLGGGQAARHVFLIDTYELAGPLDRWLRETFVPSLPGDALVVVAGRTPPTGAWRTDPGWRALARSVGLRNLDHEAASEYLTRVGVPGELHDGAVRLTHGHPLALALLGDVVRQHDGPGPPALPAGLAEAPDVVRPLQHLFLDGVWSDRHRAGLEATAHVRAMNEELLGEALPGGDTHELFGWLRSVSFVEETPHGLHLHDLVRDVLDANLRWRDPAAYMDLRRRIRPKLVERIVQKQGAERRRAIGDLIFLHRGNPVFSSFYDWESFGSAYGDVLRDGDRDALLEITRLHQGDDAAAITDHWLGRQPEAFRVVRGPGGDVAGYALILSLHDASADDRARDPGAAAMWEYAQAHAPPRPGDQVYAARNFVDRRAHQGPSPVAEVAAIFTVENWFGATRPSWDFLGCWVDPERVAPVMAYMDYHRAPEADYEVGGVRYGVFAHDFRRVSLEEWLELAHGRELVEGFDPDADAPRAPAATQALSRGEFADAVRAALRDLHRDDALSANPLMGARFLRDRSGDSPQPHDLREALADAVDALGVDPRDEKLHRAVTRTFVRPARTQELAAEALGVPFSTYRRHLKRGTERVVEWVWQRELYGATDEQQMTW